MTKEERKLKRSKEIYERIKDEIGLNGSTNEQIGQLIQEACKLQLEINEKNNSITESGYEKAIELIKIDKPTWNEFVNLTAKKYYGRLNEKQVDKYEETCSSKRHIINLKQSFFDSYLSDNPLKVVDEYDNQLVSQLNNGTEYEKYRKLLSKFYEVIKNRFEHVEFMFITGVTRFSNVSIFSCFNNLKDITLNPKYAGLFGFTDEELDNYFELFLEYAAKVLNKSLDLFKSELKNYYDGYCFDMFAKVHVFNPWSVLKFFDDCELGFQPYWTDSGFQSLIVEYFAAQAKIGENNYSFGHLINPRTLSQSQLKNNATIADLSLEAILFQSGYLTIQSADGDDFTIAPPNHELKKFLANLFFDHIVNCKIRDQIGNAFSTKSKQALRDKNTDSLTQLSQFRIIPKMG